MLVALPSSIAFGVVVFSAIAPEYAGQGALAGILGAAALGMVAPLVGRNGGFVSAPCAPSAAVLSGLAVSLGASGVPPARVLGLVTLTMAGSAGLQVVYGFARAGRLIKFIPYQVVTGYLSGVALIIFVKQLPNVLGAGSAVHFWEAVTSPHLWRWPSIVVGAVTIGVTALAPKVTKRVPAAILGLAAGVGTYFGIALLVPGLLTLEGNSLVVGPIAASGFGAVFSTRFVALQSLSLADVGLVVGPAITLSVLLSIDTLKTGVVLDALTHRRHDSNRELVAQGVANFAAFLTGGMPGAGTMGPTLVNVTSGGGSVRSSFIEGALALLGVLVLSPAIAWVPIGALAGVLLVISARMFDFGSFRLLRNPETRLDFGVIAAVVVVAETVGLIEASVTGVVLAIFLFIRAQIRGTVLSRKQDLTVTRSKRRRPPDDQKLLAEHGREALVVQLQGDLFFGTTDQLFTQVEPELRTIRYLLLDFRRVQSMDYTGAHLIEQMRQRLRDHGGELLFSGMPSSLPSRQDLQRYLRQLGLVKETGGIPIFETRDSALEWMEDRVLEAAGATVHASAPALGLADFEVLRGLGDEVLAASMRELSVPAGAAIFSRGDKGDELFFVRRGRVHIRLPLENGKVHHLATFSRGEFFGEIAFLDQGARTADAVAATDVELFVLSRRTFDHETIGHEARGAALYQRLAMGISERLRTADTELLALEER